MPASADQSAVSRAGSPSAARRWKPLAISEMTAMPTAASGVVHSPMPVAIGTTSAMAAATSATPVTMTTGRGRSSKPTQRSMPRTLSFEQAAAVPLAGITALLAVRDGGRVQAGQRVLVNGASAGVGTFAVQLAVAMGAEVTGVCGPRNLDLVRRIGATEVVDHTTTDVTRGGGRFDLVVDVAGGHSIRAFRRILTHDGALVVVGGPGGRWVQPAGQPFAAVALNAFVSQRMLMTEVVGNPDVRANLMTLTEYLDDGRVVPVVGRTYPFAEIPAAVRYQEDGRASGKVVVTS